MGTDCVSLFDKQLCDEIVALDTQSVDRFVRDHWNDLGEFSIFRIASGGQSAVTAVLTEQLLAEGSTLGALKEDLAHQLCPSKEEIRLDYWGCYVEVFKRDPHGSVSALTLFPTGPEQTFLLLLPEHVDLMLGSLRAHKEELRVMSDWEISKLEQWKRKCEDDARDRVAYFFDY